jgi:hypothetical protein
MTTEKDTYNFHQTPSDLAKDLIALLPLQQTDVLCEPFKGEGAFYNNFPSDNPKVWAEIRQQKDYTQITEPYDWVITNPPFRLDNQEGRARNAVAELLLYFLQRARKGVAFLVSDYGLGTLTPRRRKEIEALGFNLTSMTMCQIKKWRGRYYFLVFTKSQQTCLSYLENGY